MRFDEGTRGENDVQSRSQRRRTATALFSTLWLALMRMARRPWLLAVVAVGVIAIDILACTVPLYLKLIATTQLKTAIAQAPTQTRNMQVYAHSDASDAAIHQWAAAQIEAQAGQDLASFSEAAPLRYLQSDTLALMRAGLYTYNLGAAEQAQLESFGFSVIAPHIRLLQGHLPETAPAGQPTQILITQEMADGHDLRVGQRFTITNYVYRRPNTQQPPISLLITGIWTPLSDIDPFWNGLRFRSTITPLQTYPPPLWPLLTTQSSLYATLAAFPHIGVTQNWVYYVDAARVTSSNGATISDDLTTFRVRLANTFDGKSGEAQVGMRGHLEQLIQQTQSQLNFLSLPLYMIAIQIVALALLFVAAMARLLVTAQEQEIVTLKSRGASSPQLLGVLTAQSIPPGVLAALAGPLLAVGISLLLVRAFLPDGAADVASLTTLTNGYSVTSLASLTQSVAHILSFVTPALAGSVVGIGVVIAAGFGVARLDVLAFRRELARPTHIPVWQRYYLDLGLVALCVVGYLELAQFGNTQTRLQLNTQNTSLLLLVAPALLLLAGGLLLLRLVPLVARLGARLAQRGRGLAGLLALAQIARTPTRYTRMILLLALAVGLGLFALAFDASLTQNTQDRIAYATGADIRLETFTTVGGQQANAYSQRLRGLPGVAAVTSVYRTTGSVQVGQQQAQTADALGVDPGTFGNVVAATSWRSDFATRSLPALMAQLRAHEQGADAGSQTHPLWAIISASLAERLHAHVGDRFLVTLSDVGYKPTNAIVGAVVAEFPTLYPNNAPGGFIVFNAHDLTTTIVANAVSGTVVGANEFWLRTTGDLTTDHNLTQTLGEQAFHFSINGVNGIQSYREDLAQVETNPINGGMRGLLLLGALVAALLAVLGSVTQTVLTARRRNKQFAVLRTLGMGSRQLVGALLREQLVVYLFGLLGGTVLGLILLSATIPYLQFSDALIDPSVVGVPAYLLRINWATIGVFYGALLVAFLIALVVTARFVATIGLGKALRVGED